MAVTINGTTGIVTPDITSDSATIDSTTLVVDETNNRVGIGTSSPDGTLHIVGQSTSLPALIAKNASGANADTPIFEAINGGGNTRLIIRNDGDLQFNSGYGSVATAYGCRAWVNFDGTQTAANMIRESGNVSSITDNGTGSYTVNFTTAMPDANYVCNVNASSQTDTINLNPASGVNRSTTTVRIDSEVSGGSQYDAGLIDVVVFR